MENTMELTSMKQSRRIDYMQFSTDVQSIHLARTGFLDFRTFLFDPAVATESLPSDSAFDLTPAFLLPRHMATTDAKYLHFPTNFFFNMKSLFLSPA